MLPGLCQPLLVLQHWLQHFDHLHFEVRLCQHLVARLNGHGAPRQLGIFAPLYAAAHGGDGLRSRRPRHHHDGFIGLPKRARHLEGHSRGGRQRRDGAAGKALFSLCFVGDEAFSTSE